MLMRKKLLNFALTIALFAIGSNAYAQFTSSIDLDYKTDYSTTAASFNLTEVATALGTDTATLKTAYAAFEAGETSDVNVTLTSTGGNVYPNDTLAYTQGTTGNFWMTVDGDACNWGTTNCAWYNMNEVNTAEDLFTFWLGIFPDFTAGGTATATYTLYYGEKSCTFTITATIAAKPTGVSVDTNVFSELEIVKTVEATLEMTNNDKYEAEADTVNVSDIAELLGVELSALQAATSDNVYMRIYDYSNTQAFTDTIANWIGTTNGWAHKIEDESTGEYTGEMAMGAWGENCIVYVQDFAISDDGQLTYNVGPYPGVDDNTTWYTTFYIVAGTKAYAVKLTVTLKEEEAKKFEMSLKNTYDFDVELYPSLTYSQPKTTALDLTSILADLEAEAIEDDAFYAYKSSSQEFGSEYLTNSYNCTPYPGFWMAADGTYVGSWGSSASYGISLDVSSGEVSWFVMPGTTNTEVGTSQAATFFIVNPDNGNTVQLNFNITYADYNPLENIELNLVKTLTYDVQLIAEQGYSQVIEENTDSAYTVAIDVETILAALETEETAIGSDWLYAFKEGATELVDSLITNSYNCTPNPGFWMSEDGTWPAGWGNTAAYGMTLDVSTGETSWYAIPSGTQAVTGNTFTGNFFIVNTENGNVVKLVFNIEYVESRSNVEEVGTEEVNIIISEDNQNADGLYYVANDLAACLEALGITKDEYDSGIWQAKNSAGAYVNIESFEGEDAGFDAEGAYVGAEEPVFAIGYDAEEGQFTGSLYGEEMQEDTKYTATVAFRYDDKRYVFNVVLGTATGINAVEADEAAGKQGVYTITGVRLNNANNLQRGIYIINGKKTLVK